MQRYQLNLISILTCTYTDMAHDLSALRYRLNLISIFTNTKNVLWTTEKYLFRTLILGPKKHNFELSLWLHQQKFSLKNIYQVLFFLLGTTALLSLYRFFWGMWGISCLPPPSICADLVNKTSVCRVNALLFIFHMFGRQKDPKTAWNYLIQETQGHRTNYFLVPQQD